METVLLIYNNFHKRHVSATHPLSGKLSSPFNLNNMGRVSNHSNLPLKRRAMTHDGANHNSLWHFSKLKEKAFYSLENGNPLQYACLENSMGRGALRATVYGVTKSWTQLKQLTYKYLVTWAPESSLVRNLKLIIHQHKLKKTAH